MNMIFRFSRRGGKYKKTRNNIFGTKNERNILETCNDVAKDK